MGINQIHHFLAFLPKRENVHVFMSKRDRVLFVESDQFHIQSSIVPVIFDLTKLTASRGHLKLPHISSPTRHAGAIFKHCCFTFYFFGIFIKNQKKKKESLIPSTASRVWRNDVLLFLGLAVCQRGIWIIAPKCVSVPHFFHAFLLHFSHLHHHPKLSCSNQSIASS